MRVQNSISCNSYYFLSRFVEVGEENIHEFGLNTIPPTNGWRIWVWLNGESVGGWGRVGGCCGGGGGGGGGGGTVLINAQKSLDGGRCNDVVWLTNDCDQFCPRNNVVGNCKLLCAGTVATGRVCWGDIIKGPGTNGLGVIGILVIGS